LSRLSNLLDKVSAAGSAALIGRAAVSLSWVIAALCDTIAVQNEFEVACRLERLCVSGSGDRKTPCYRAGMNASISEYSGFQSHASGALAWAVPPGVTGTSHNYRTGSSPQLLWVKEPSGTTWRDVHRQLVELSRRRAAHERELCHWLCEAERLSVHVQAGYASLREYAERMLGLSARQTEERLRVGRAFGDLPELEHALRTGELCWSVVRELTRVATAHSERAWIRWSRGRRAQEVERAVAERQAGDGPDTAGDPNRVRHRLCFDVRAETIALFRELQARIKKELGGAGQPVDDDTLLFELARRALGGPDDAGRASYQVAVSRCDACGQTSIDAGGRTHPVDTDVESLIACDAQQVGNVGELPHLGASTSHSSAHPHLGGTLETTAHPNEVAEQSSQRRSNDEVTRHSRAPRATQTIPPAIRRRVFRRHHGRCAVAGCLNHRFLDVHHAHPKVEGGTHDPNQMTLLCGAHHRAIHRGQLILTGTASIGFAFQHADGSPYGAPFEPSRVDVAQKVFAALTQLGFKPSQARARIDGVQRRSAPAALREFLLAALHVG
jgi:hypothetical protein